MKTMRRANSDEETIPMSFRVGRSRAEALKDAIAAMAYPLSQSALIDRAIDLLIKDMKKKKEI